jgi:hypothetical protein
MAIRVAATLHLADHIAAGVTDLDALSRTAGADRSALGRVMRHLAAVNVFAETEPDRYRLTDLSKGLCDQGPGDTRSWLDLTSAVGRADLALTYLLEVVRSGRPEQTRYTWAALDADRALSDSFDGQMAAGAVEKGPVLAAGYDWSGVRHVVDVGGGNGTLLVGLLSAHPHLRGTVVDRPGPADNAARAFAAAGLADRAGTAPGSFFDPLPTGADVYLLSAILHDWPDAEATRILGRCAEAAGRTGRVLVMESLVEPGPARSSTTDMDLLMLVTTGGRARQLDELTALAATAGLRAAAVTTLADPHTLIEFVKQ